MNAYCTYDQFLYSWIELNRAVTLVAEDGSALTYQMAERHVSLPRPFASGDVHEWFQRFEICCRANGWNAATQALKLPTLLEGEALAIWLELNEEEQKNYSAAKEKLLSAMMPMKFVSLDDFRQRNLRPGEALPVYLHDMKVLEEGLHCWYSQGLHTQIDLAMAIKILQCPVKALSCYC